MKKILIFLCLIIIFSCKKYKNIQSDAEGDSYIRGRLFLYDTLTKNSLGNPLPGKTVQLYYNNSIDTINFILSVITDKDGYFIFKNLNKDSTYRVYYNEKNDTSSVIYTAERKKVKPPVDTLSLNAYLDSTKEPGLHYTIRDSMGAPVKGASICIFANADFFQQGTCANSSYPLTTDANGHAFIFNIPSITYYTTAYIAVNGSVYLINDTTLVSDTITFKTLILGKVKQTGYIYHVVDEFNNPFPGVGLCFFTSSIPYSNSDCSGSNFQDTSDSQGIAKGISIFPATYYVLASVKIDTVSYIGKDTINIVKDIIKNDTIMLRKK